MKANLQKLFIFASFLLLGITGQAATITGMTPLSGLPGTQVTLNGEFDPNQSTLKVGGISVPIASATASEIRFNIPSGLVSGIVEVSDGGNTTPYPLPLSIYRTITGTFSPPAGVSAQNQTVISGNQETITAANGTFTTTIITGRPVTIWIFKDGQPSTFLSTVIDSDATATISARTTALTLALNNPMSGRRDPADFGNLRTTLSSDPDTTTLTTVISEAAQENRDYLDDARFEPPLIALIESIIAMTPPAPQGFKVLPTTLSDVKLREANISGVSTVFDSTIKADPQRINDFLLFDNARTTSRNSLDWSMELFRVNPQSFPNGLADIQDLGGLSSVVPANSVPLQTGFARAELLSSKIDLLGALAGEVFKLSTGLLKDGTGLDLAPPKTTEFRLDRRIPEIYLVQSYSGNIALGLEQQSDLLDAVDPNSQWAFSLAGNVMIAAIDAVGAFTSVGDLLGVDSKFIHSLNVSIAKRLAVYRGREDLDAGTFLDVAKSAATTTIKKLYKNAIGGATAEQLAKRAAKVVGKTFDVLGKVSSGLQAVERTAGLLRDRTQAIERSLIVVGNPFSPFISAVSPNSIREGTTVVVRGGNFGSTIGEISVSLCSFNETSGAIAAELPVTPTSVTPTQIRFTIPTAATFRSTFTNSEAFVCITKGASETPGGPQATRSTSLGNDGKLTMPAPPSVIAMQPSQPGSGGIPEVIIGQNRSIIIEVANGDDKMAAVIDGFTPVEVLQSRPGAVVAFLPQLGTGNHTIQITSKNELGPAFSFTVVRPTDANRTYLSGYSRITITKADMSNTPDGEISIKEAFLIANGGLGRLIEQHVNGEPSGTRRESDHVSGNSGGAGRRDIIRIASTLGAGPFAINEAIPAIDAADRIQLGGITLNGSGTPAGTDGFVIDGSSDVEIRDVTLTGFPGDGIRVTNGIKGASFLNITISGAGGDGIYLDNECDHNSFQTIEILQVGGRGLNVSGNSKHNQFKNFQIDGTGATGVRVADGAEENLFEDFSITNVTGTGILLEEDVSRNRFAKQCDVSICTGHGIYLTGSGTLYNAFYNDPGSNFIDAGMVSVSPAVRDCQKLGLLIAGGASSNHVIARFISNNNEGGVKITGSGTFDNTVGHPYRLPPSTNSFPQQKLFFTIITDNNGPGILLETGTSQTLLTGLSVHGNQGDGIVLEDSSFNYILSVRSGIQDFIDNQVAIADPNTGASIRFTGNCSNNRLGTILEVTKFNFGRSPTEDFTNILANDLGGGIILNGECDFNQIDGTFIGGITASQQRVMGHGLTLINGASSNRIGSLEFNSEFSVLSCEQDGILIDGPTTINNTLLGISMGHYNGTTPGTKVMNGIHLRNGAHSNLIGGPGPMIGGGSQFSGPLNETIRMTNLLGTGVWFEACGGRAGTDQVISEQNTLQNCSINGCDTGIHLSDNAKVNEIGGFLGHGPKGGGFFRINDFYTVDSNRVSGFQTAGLRYSRMTLTSPLLRNPIRNTSFSTNQTFPSDPISTTVPDGVGILIDPDAGHIIVGEDPSTPVTVSGCPVGIYLNQTSHNQIKAINISGSFGPVNAAGIVLANSSENQIGLPGALANTITGIKGPAGSSHGIALFESDENTIAGNTVSFCSGAGIYLEDSTLNLIGGANYNEGNEFLANGTHGIHFSGTGTLANRAHSNFIGITRGGKRQNEFNESYAQVANGILLEGGASSNRIGGPFVQGVAGVTTTGPGSSIALPAGNTIIANISRGVLVSGSNTRANPILDNSISENLEGGISLAAGNDSMPAPTGTHGPGVASGTVPNLNAVPPGSLVQIFTDTGLQGELLIGSTTVNPGGSWTATNLTGAVYQNVTATFTHPTSESTSPFGLLTGTSSSFTLERTGGGTPAPLNIPFSSETVAQRITLTANGSDVRINRLTFKAEGTLDDLAAVSSGRLYHDQNGNGVRDESDFALTAQATFDQDNGILIMDDLATVLEAGSSQDWLLVYEPAHGVAQQGDTFNLKITDATAVGAETFFPSGIPVTATNPFPVRSDLFTVGAPLPAINFATFINDAFPGETNPLIVAPNADPDRDGIPNLLEFLFGTDPDDSGSSSQVRVIAENGQVGIEFDRSNRVEGVTVAYETSTDLITWVPSTGGTISTNPSGVGETIGYTINRSGDFHFLRITATLD